MKKIFSITFFLLVPCALGLAQENNAKYTTSNNTPFRRSPLFGRNKIVSPTVATPMDDSMQTRNGWWAKPRGGSVVMESPFSSIVNTYNEYLDALDRNPVVTKGITTAAVMGIGNILSQWIEATVAGQFLVLNWSKVIVFFFCGLFYVGPYVHSWYEQLWKIGRWMENNYGSSKSQQTLAQVAIDQTIGVAIFFSTYFYVYEFIDSIIGWRAPIIAAASANMHEQISSVLVTQYYVWPLTNFVSFAYVPQSLRVLVNNLVGVFWNAYLCTKVGG